MARIGRWLHFLGIFLATVVAGGLLLCLLRVHPKYVHEFLLGVEPWLRIGTIVAVCTLLSWFLIHLLSPRLRQLQHFLWNPPAWIAVGIGTLVIAALDLAGRLSPNGYRATHWEWLGYGAGSLVLVLLVGRRRIEDADDRESQAGVTASVEIQDLADAPWDAIEDWLRTDAGAQCDLLNNRVVARRLSKVLVDGKARSIGVVGKFGAGKSTLVSWIRQNLEQIASTRARFIVCQHSCWGFEESAAAIADMLRSAITKIGTEVDTFQIDSLPESYRKTFSGGDWVGRTFDLFWKSPTAVEQFAHLSRLLGELNARLVFIVEDLDRSDTRGFEVQEVLAFLERLKPHKQLSFILTGGPSASRSIDFSKLCDHIEHLRAIKPDDASLLAMRLRERCLDGNVFEQHPLGDDRRYVWDSIAGTMTAGYEEQSLLQAVSMLLDTPRSLRHALGRTYLAWEAIHGEINFDELLALNVLRYGAPECFLFALRNWERIRSEPTAGRDRPHPALPLVRDDWASTVARVEWHPAAARRVVEFILPTSQPWLSDAATGSSATHPQGLTHERYLLRAINEAIDDCDPRDQVVIRDCREWLATRSPDAALIRNLSTSDRYVYVCEHLLDHSLESIDFEGLSALCSQVLARIAETDGPAASGTSTGFSFIAALARRRVAIGAIGSELLQRLFRQAAVASLELANALWQTLGRPGHHCILLDDDRASVRAALRSHLQSTVTNADALIARLSTEQPFALYRLLFDQQNTSSIANAATWQWLGAAILDGLRQQNVAVAVNCINVLTVSRGERAFNEPVLSTLFNGRVLEVVECLEAMTGVVPDCHRLEQVVDAARQMLGEANSARGSADSGDGIP